ncbi:MAG: hypothetical protein ACRC3H_07270 [Lachnospiraceae bacterium]
MTNYTGEQLKDIIEQDYGFKRELIINPVLHGLWCVSFEVLGIKYCGSTPFAGALPLLSVAGYAHPYFQNYIPVTEDYYNDFIKDKRIVLRKFIPYAKNDPDNGEWKSTIMEFSSQDEANKYIDQLDNPHFYDYEFID